MGWNDDWGPRCVDRGGLRGGGGPRDLHAVSGVSALGGSGGPAPRDTAHTPEAPGPPMDIEWWGLPGARVGWIVR